MLIGQSAELYAYVIFKMAFKLTSDGATGP